MRERGGGGRQQRLVTQHSLPPSTAIRFRRSTLDKQSAAEQQCKHDVASGESQASIEEGLRPEGFVVAVRSHVRQSRRSAAKQCSRTLRGSVLECEVQRRPDPAHPPRPDALARRDEPRNPARAVHGPQSRVSPNFLCLPWKYDLLIVCIFCSDESKATSSGRSDDAYVDFDKLFQQYMMRRVRTLHVVCTTVISRASSHCKRKASIYASNILHVAFTRTVGACSRDYGKSTTIILILYNVHV